MLPKILHSKKVVVLAIASVLAASIPAAAGAYAATPGGRPLPTPGGGCQSGC